MCSVGLLTAVAISSTGCSWWRKITGNEKPAETLKPVPSITSSSNSQSVAPALQPVNRPVAQGSLPMVYLVESNATIRVVNVASGEEVASFPAKTSQIVRVETQGVLLQNKPVMGAQLSPGTYAIYRDEPGAGVLVVEQARQVPVLKPTTQPEPQAAPQPGSIADTPPPVVPPHPGPASTQPATPAIP